MQLKLKIGMVKLLLKYGWFHSIPKGMLGFIYTWIEYNIYVILFAILNMVHFHGHIKKLVNIEYHRNKQSNKF